MEDRGNYLVSSSVSLERQEPNSLCWIVKSWTVEEMRSNLENCIQVSFGKLKSREIPAILLSIPNNARQRGIMGVTISMHTQRTGMRQS